MIYVLLAAESQTERETMRALFQKIPLPIDVQEAQSEEKVLQLAKIVTFSLVVLDTRLKDGSGLHCAVELRKMRAYALTWLIFVSAYADCMLDAFRQVHCYEFLIKPYNASEFQRTVRLLLERENTVQADRPACLFHSGQTDFKVYIDEIIFLEVNARACTIHTKERQYRLNRVPLKEALQRISSPDIVQTHKSYAVNLRHVRHIERYSLTSWNIHFDHYPEIALLGNKYKEKILQMFESMGKGNTHP